MYPILVLQVSFARVLVDPSQSVPSESEVRNGDLSVSTHQVLQDGVVYENKLRLQTPQR